MLTPLTMAEIEKSFRVGAGEMVGEVATEARLLLRVVDIIQNPRAWSGLKTYLGQMLPTIEASLLLQGNTANLGDILYCIAQVYQHGCLDGECACLLKLDPF